MTQTFLSQFLGLYHSKKNILFIGDIHSGEDQYLSKNGIFSLDLNLAEIKETLLEIVSSKTYTKIILLGDLAIRFKPLTKEDEEHIQSILDILSKHTKKIIVLKGNHDIFLTQFLSSQGISFLDFYEEDDFICVHGDKPFPFPLDKTIIIGHEHPCVSISDGIRKEVFKCTLKIPYNKKCLYVLPSISQLRLGIDLTKESPLGPILTSDILKKGDVYVHEKNDSFLFKNFFSL